MADFDLQLPFQPAGDQPQAIRELTEGVNRGDRWQTLLGVTGSGKTVTMAGVIAETGKPTLVMSHNKTLAAQLYGELRQFFPKNAVEYFISYYDYYQPEAYVPQTDTFIEKDASINEDIDRLRLRATTALMERQDVIVVASVSAIYGLGNPASYKRQVKQFRVGQQIERNELLGELVGIQYRRDDLDFQRGSFRVRGDTIEIYPAYEEQAIRIEMWGDEIEKITRIDPNTGQKIVDMDRCGIFPASHYATSEQRLEKAADQIERELEERLLELRQNEKHLEAQRLEQRIQYDLEMIREMGFCPGIENYARYLDGREPGERPYCLYDYFPDDFLVILDESHVSVPQIGGMYKGDRSRKETLVEHGFRLPSALDNRPLQFEEWENVTGQTIFVSATPGDYELEKTRGVVVEQVVRPTGLVDPDVEVRPVDHQVDDLLEEARKRAEEGERVLVTTLTKRMAEDLTQYLDRRGVAVEYMHSDIDSIERVEILRGLRLGEFDVLVGINLLREGLDLPEVSLVAILDADKEGFLRSETSLIQTIGRAARNINGKAILYADQITGSMQRASEETERRRKIQQAHNEKHDITPTSIEKSVEEIQFSTSVADARGLAGDQQNTEERYTEMEGEKLVEKLEEEMREAAHNREYERAARLRDQLFEARAALDDQPDSGNARRRKKRSRLQAIQAASDT